MAELIVDGDSLEVRLKALEKAEVVHGEVRVTLEAAPFDELIVGCDDPESVAATLRRPG